MKQQQKLSQHKLAVGCCQLIHPSSERSCESAYQLAVLSISTLPPVRVPFSIITLDHIFQPAPKHMFLKDEK